MQAPTSIKFESMIPEMSIEHSCGVVEQSLYRK